MYLSIVAIAGVPRSGTSWLGQIIDSSPIVAYRFQPIFSWAFKNAVGFDSTREDYESFFQNIYKCDDDFLCQTKRKLAGYYPLFVKSDEAKVLAIKNVRYHYLLANLLHNFDDLKVIAIVRHPCGVINSWLTTPKEFPDDADPLVEWRHAPCRNTGPEEYWGFEKWKQATELFLRLENSYPNRVSVVNYESLVGAPSKISRKLFRFLKLDWTQQTEDFLTTSHGRHDDHSYSVFKDTSVRDRWRKELDPHIVEKILAEVRGTSFERFVG